MNKIIFTILMAFFISSCGIPDQITRNKYAGAYQQPDYYIKIYQQKINSMSIEDLAKDAVAIEKSRMKGQSSLKLDDFITVENVSSQANKVIFDYSLSNNWSLLSKEKQNAYKNKMQKDLVYHTCSLKTVRLAQERGLEEEHNYYVSYPKNLIFTLKTNKQICINNGFI